MASVFDLVSLVRGINQVCQDVSSSKKIVKVAGDKLATIVPVLQQLESRDTANNSPALESLKENLLEVQRQVVKAQKMNHILYIVKASSIHDDIESLLGQIHFSLGTISVSQNIDIHEQLGQFQNEWKAEMEALRKRESQDRRALLAGKSEAVLKLTNGDLDDIQEAQEAIEKEHEELQHTLLESRDSIQKGKLEQEQAYIEQIIVALELAEQQQQQQEQQQQEQMPMESLDGVGGIEDWAICPVTQEIMKDPVQMDGPCGHTVSRSAAQEWMSRNKRICPLCSTDLRSSFTQPNAPLRDAIARMLAKQKRPCQENDAERAFPSTKAPPRPSPSDPPAALHREENAATPIFSAAGEGSVPTMRHKESAVLHSVSPVMRPKKEMEKDIECGEDLKAVESFDGEKQATMAESFHKVSAIGKPHLSATNPIETESQSIAVRAEEARDNKEGAPKRPYLQWGLIAGSFFVVLAVIVVVAVVLGKDNGSSSNSATEAAPNQEFVLSLLPNETQNDVLENPGSPQARAYQWLKSDTQLMEREYSNQTLQQRYAMATFYYATGGSGWTEKDQWLNNTAHECTWGFASEIADFSPCDGDFDESTTHHYDLKHLSLPRNGLDGTIPREISWLTSLETFDLYENNLQGTIPTEMGEMTQLVELDLTANALTGRIPSTLGNLGNLAALFLEQNQLIGNVPKELGKAPLLNLRLQSNNMEGELPEEICNVRNLGIDCSKRFCGCDDCRCDEQ